jgi:hypothetical protein
VRFVSGHTGWGDLKRTRTRVGAGVLRAPTVLVEVERDGPRWMFRIPEWGLFGHAESLDAVEDAARDLIGTAVGIAVVVDAHDAADEAERQGM